MSEIAKYLCVIVSLKCNAAQQTVLYSLFNLNQMIHLAWL